MSARAPILAGFLSLLLSPAFAQQPPVSFMMPSGNVTCTYTPAGGSTVYKSADGSAELSCDRAAPTYLRVTMTEVSKVVIETKVTDQGCCGGEETLAYGTTWRRGPFSCDSKQVGVTCKRADGRGFTVSRAGIRPF